MDYRQTIGTSRPSTSSNEARRIVPVWDVHTLVDQFDQYENSKKRPLTNLPRVFLQWLKEFTPGKSPS
jgi:hypothetical protein